VKKSPKAKPRKTHRKVAAKAQTIHDKGKGAMLGAAVDCEDEQRLLSDLLYVDWVCRLGEDPNLPGHDIGEQREGRADIAEYMIERAVARDVEFFERMAKVTRLSRDRGGCANTLGFQMTLALSAFAEGVLKVEGKKRTVGSFRVAATSLRPDKAGIQDITSPLLCEILEQMFGGAFDASNIRREARGLGITFPVECAKLRAEKKERMRVILTEK
jgi:hypothetical protein